MEIYCVYLNMLRILLFSENSFTRLKQIKFIPVSMR